MVYGNKGMIPFWVLIGITSYHAGGGAIQFWNIGVSRTQPFSCYFLCVWCTKPSPPAAIMSFLDHPSARDAGRSSFPPSPSSSWTIAEPARDFVHFFYYSTEETKKIKLFFFFLTNFKLFFKETPPRTH